ncbi:MAG: fibronectin type III domain-containing protein [Ignavibacteria bacterium]
MSKSGFTQSTDDLIQNPVNSKNAIYIHDLVRTPKVSDIFNRSINNPIDAVNVYGVTRTTGITYTPIAGGTSVTSWRNLANIDDNMSNNQPIGFSLVYNGVRSTEFRVNTSGFITFNTTSSATGAGTGAYGYDNTQFSSSTGSLNTLAPMYDDLQVVNLSTSIVYQTTGFAGNRILTVEFIGMDFSGDTTPDLNFQIKVYEIDGHIEYVYGTMTPGVAVYTYSSGINASTLSAVPTAAQLLTQQTANSGTFSNTVQNALAAVPATNSMISFATPVQTAPASPSNLTFTAVTTTTMTLNWIDNSTNETGFPIYISTDNVNFDFVGTAGANAISASFSGLTPSTTYYFQVWASNETMFSPSAATGSQSTAVAVPLSGAYTINPSLPVSSTNFQTFSQTDIELMSNGVSGPVTFTVSGGTYAERSLLGPIPGVSSTNTVTYNGPVSDARVVVSATGTAATNDYGIALIGADFVTYNNIDVTDAGTSTANQIEYGYYLQTSGTSDGAQNNTVRGANILLGGGGVTPGFSHGILQSTVAGATQSNNGNRYLNNRVDRSDRGIAIFGLTAPALPTENNIEVSGNILGQTILIGDNLTTTAGSPIGIIISNCSNALVFNNDVVNVSATLSTSTSSPIGMSGQNSSGKIYNNYIRKVFSANTASATVRPIGIQGSGLASSPLNIYNNFVSNVTKSYSGAATLTIGAVGLRSTQQGGAGVVNWYFNSVYLAAPAAVNYTSAGFQSFAGGVNITLKNNILFNNIANVSTSRSYAINEGNTANTFYVGQYNDLYAPAAGGNTGLKAATLTPTLADWRTATGQDLSSVAVSVTFANTAIGDLHLAGASIGDQNLGGTPVAGITFDIDGNTRNAVEPYKGADEAGTVLASSLTLTINFEACNAEDTITVELRNATSPFALVDSQKGLGGQGVPHVINFANAVDGTPYYIVVIHRNSIRTFSGSTPSFTAGSLNYNFTTASSQAFGNNMVQVGLLWSLYTGDVNQDGIVDGSDGSLVDNDAFNFVSGYVVTDVNCDGIVDGSDAVFVEANATNFVQAITP